MVLDRVSSPACIADRMHRSGAGWIPARLVGKKGRKVGGIRSDHYSGFRLLLRVIVRTIAGEAGKSFAGSRRLVGGRGLSVSRRLPALALGAASV